MDNPGVVKVVSTTLVLPDTLYSLWDSQLHFIKNITIQAVESNDINIRFNNEPEFRLKKHGVYWEQGIQFAGKIEVSSPVPNTTVQAVIWASPTG